MREIDIFKKDIFEDVQTSTDFVILPNKLENVVLKREVIFEFQTSSVQSNIVYKCLALGCVDLDLTVKLSSKDISVDGVTVYLEVHILNIGLENKIKVKPFLEIPHQNVKFEHKVTIGAPDTKWVNYLRSKGLSEDSAKQLIIESFI